MDLSHNNRKDLSDNADLDLQAVGPALHIMQLNVERLSAAKCNTHKRKQKSAFPSATSQHSQECAHIDDNKKPKT